VRLDDALIAENTRGQPAGRPPGEARPLVSIVVISFNYERYLATAIDSALSQTYPEIEVIAVDDGSTDRSREIIDGYGVRVRPVFKENGGEVSASNAGFAASRGDIVLFLDSDDFLRPGAVERIVAAMAPGVSAVQTSVLTVDGAGRPLGSILPPLPRGWSPARIRRTMRRTGNYPHPPTSGNAYARWFLERVMPVDPAVVPLGLDGLLNRIAALHGAVVPLGEPLVGYRFHDANMGAAPGGPDPDRLNFYVALDLRNNTAVLAEAQRLGFPLDARAVERGFYFAQYRLASRKLRPSLHPIADDTIFRALRRFLEAAALAPDEPLRRILLALWGVCVAAAPRTLAARLVDLRFSSHRRPQVLETLFRRLRLVRRVVSPASVSLLRARPRQG
jgi:glycosyltransferase involved in cell wall biosynthesis